MALNRQTPPPYRGKDYTSGSYNSTPRGHSSTSYGASGNPYGSSGNSFGSNPGNPYGTPGGGYYNNIPDTPAMSFGQALATCFSKYFDFSGRATRAEFWWWILFVYGLNFFISTFIFFLPYNVEIVIACMFYMAVLIPTLAVAWRRLHDIGKGGGYFFCGLIPLVGAILMIVWYASPSQPYDNRFGPYRG